MASGKRLLGNFRQYANRLLSVSSVLSVASLLNQQPFYARRLEMAIPASWARRSDPATANAIRAAMANQA